LARKGLLEKFKEEVRKETQHERDAAQVRAEMSLMGGQAAQLGESEAFDVEKERQELLKRVAEKQRAKTQAPAS
jgi:hypothetical protein